MGRDAQEVCRIWLRGWWVVLPRPSLQDWQCWQLVAFSLVSLGELPSAGESHLAQDYFLRAAQFLGWVNIGVLRQGSLLQFGAILKEHPSSRAPRGKGWGLCCDCLKVHSSQPFLACFSAPQVRSPEDSPISFLHTNLHLNNLFLGESVTMTKTFCIKEPYYSPFLIPFFRIKRLLISLMEEQQKTYFTIETLKFTSRTAFRKHGLVKKFYST